MRSGGSSLVASTVDGAVARAGELAAVVVRHETVVRVRRQHAFDAVQSSGKLVLSELGRGDLGFGEREELPLAIAFGHERLERLREPVRRAALGDD